MAIIDRRRHMLSRNDSDIDQLLDENNRVIVMFGASWCGPCKIFKPKYQTISLENSDIVFAYCDVDDTRDTAIDLNIQSVPTVVSFFNGIEQESVVGPTVDKVKALVENLRTKNS